MSEHSYPLEVDAASKAHKSTYGGTMRNGRTGIMVCILCFLVVVFIFAGSFGAVTVGIIGAMITFVFLGGRWISAFAWGIGGTFLLMVVAFIQSLIVG